MVGFRFSLVLDFGVGTAATGRSCARHGYSARRLEEGRRPAVSSRPAALPLPEELGRGPLELEDFGQEFAGAQVRGQYAK